MTCENMYQPDMLADLTWVGNSQPDLEVGLVQIGH